MIVFPKNLIYSQFFVSECYFQMHPVIRSNICFLFNSTRVLCMGLSVHSPREAIVALISFFILMFGPFALVVPTGKQLTHSGLIVNRVFKLSHICILYAVGDLHKLNCF